MSEIKNVEYTPYGETWIEKTQDSELENMLPYRFTAKELDEETGLYYYGARYLNPRTSRWISSDPAGFSLISPNRDGFNFIESQNWYSYVSNNPVVFIDPTGMKIRDPGDENRVRMNSLEGNLAGTSEPANQNACTLVGTARAAHEAAGTEFTEEAVQGYVDNSDYFDSDGNLNRNALWEDVTGEAGNWQREDDASAIPGLLQDLEGRDEDYAVTGRALIEYAGTKGEHEITINGITVGEDGEVSFSWTATSTNDEGRSFTATGTGNVNDLMGLRYQEIPGEE